MLWNLVGLGLPLVIAVITVPQLLALIGAERFGLLALAWGLIGYAGALDLGIGRATTQRIAALIGSGDTNLVPDVLATAKIITQFTGAIGMVVIAGAAMLGAHRLFPVMAVPAYEIQASIFLLALALPMQAISATYRGVNEAYLNFKGVSILRIALGAANFGAPYLVALFTIEVYWLVGTLVLSRAIALVFYRRLALTCISRSCNDPHGACKKDHAVGLLKFGAWFTVSSIVSPLLVQADRFFVGSIISVAAVTLYVLPYEIAVQALIIVGAITTVVFPAISGQLTKNPPQARIEFGIWLRRVSVGMFVVMSAVAFVMPFALHAWVGEHVSKESVVVGQLLCLGVYVNSVGSMYFTFLHAQGRTRETALLHLTELPIFLLLLFFLVTEFGIIGGAIAWLLRVAFDTTLLAVISSSVAGNREINSSGDAP